MIWNHETVLNETQAAGFVSEGAAQFVRRCQAGSGPVHAKSKAGRRFTIGGLVDYVRNREAAQNEPPRPRPKRKEPGWQAGLLKEQKNEIAAAAYSPDQSRSTPDFVHIADVLKDPDLLVTAMASHAERKAGEMRGAVRPDQRAASRDLDLIAEIEGTE